MSLGRVMIGIEGTTLRPYERQRLMHPLVAGVILFSRNYESPKQLQALCESIHNLRHPKLLIGVDHEGGRVQRFKQGFTRLPSMIRLGQHYHISAEQGMALSRQVGWLLATELLACGVDFSFAPVLDLDYGESHVIGDRAFDADPIIVGKLALHLSLGMRDAGMASVGKHFPGHGYVAADTHHSGATDPRSWAQIEHNDLQPFLKLIAHGLEAIMPAHVCYEQLDSRPAGFSKLILQDLLRSRCHFEGAIISDDLGMQAAAEYGDVVERVNLALQAGCDLALVCNDLDQIEPVLEQCHINSCPLTHARLIRLHGRAKLDLAQCHYNPIWQSAARAIKAITDQEQQKELL